MSKVSEAADSLYALATMTFVVLMIWNILNFLIFQWFGCRYYGLSVVSLSLALPLGVMVVAPAAVGCSKHAAVLGITGSVVLLVILIICLRWEARNHRSIYGD